jgi:tetratricopeptide (TPR) repeat protein
MSVWRHVLGFAGLGLLLAGQPGRADVVVEARALIEGHRLPEAREPLEKLLAREPDNLEARLLLARVYNGVGRRDEGIELLEPAVAAHPDDARVLGLYGGQCLLRAGELGLGLRALRLARRGRDLMERAVLLAPNDISYREGLVDFYRQAPMVAGGSLEKARGHAEAITRLDPVRGGAWEAAILVQEKRFPEAMAACDQALAARPDDYAALFSLGRTVSESGLRLDDGERSLRRCLEMVPAPSEPSHAGVYYRLGLIAELRGDKIAARELYRASLKLEPTFNRPAEALKRMDQP